MGENITLTEPAARIALFIGKSKYLLLLFKMRTNSVNIFRKRINRITILLSACCKTYCFAFQKRRFCTVKAALLHRKTYAFATPKRKYRFLTELSLQKQCGCCFQQNSFYGLQTYVVIASHGAVAVFLLLCFL